MNIYEKKYRTMTYLAGDWEGDKNLIDTIKRWNDDDYLSLHFSDVHDFTNSNDASLNCSIKESLRQRLKISKTFVLIVGKHTKYLRSGSCSLCRNYCEYYTMNPFCRASYFNRIDNRSFVQYECEMALKDYNAGELKNIVVIYNGLTRIDRDLCPECLRYIGTHIPSYVMDWNGRYRWNYQVIKDAICK